jgi:hypothetical protein
MRTTQGQQPSTTINFPPDIPAEEMRRLLIVLAAQNSLPATGAGLRVTTTQEQQGSPAPTTQKLPSDTTITNTVGSDVKTLTFKAGQTITGLPPVPHSCTALKLTVATDKDTLFTYEEKYISPEGTSIPVSNALKNPKKRAEVLEVLLGNTELALAEYAQTPRPLTEHPQTPSHLKTIMPRNPKAEVLADGIIQPSRSR